MRPPLLPIAGVLGVVGVVVLLSTLCGRWPLSDAELLKYAQSKFDSAGMEGKRVILGMHRGIQVVVDFPCSDMCPQNTTRMIHYDLPRGEECRRRGGVDYPMSLPGEAPKMYCVPSILADEWEKAPGWTWKKSPGSR